MTIKKFLYSELKSFLQSRSIDIESAILNDSYFLGINSLELANENDLTFFHNSKYANLLATTQAKACFIAKDHSIIHHANTDIPSAGFRPEERDGPPWDYPIPHFGDSLIDVFDNPTARGLGLGYEECENIVNHDPSQYNEKGFCINEDLKHYLKDNVYLNS